MSGSDLQRVIDESKLKTPEQIALEWQRIEEKRPGGVLPVIERLKQVRNEKYDDLSRREHLLLNVIEALEMTLASYHVEMGTLLRELKEHDSSIVLAGGSSEG